MTFATRVFPALISTLALLAALTAAATAQEATPEVPDETAAAAAAAEDAAAAELEAADPGARVPRSGYDTRSELGSLLRQHPPELATILALDPTLLSNPAFLDGYPELARFVAAHPEVRRNPRFYLAEFPAPGDGGFGEVAEMMTLFSVFLVMTFGTVWLVRTLIEQRRWSRLTRTQSEVHNKILERFGTSEALLEYMRSPAGTKFLESAPIPLRSEAPAQNPSLSRVLWSIQLGVVVAAGAIGMLVVSGRLERDAAEGFFALGVIGLCVGAGFVLSAIVSLVLSRRLGAWEGVARRDEPLDEGAFRS